MAKQRLFPKIYERCMQDVLVGLSKYDEEFEVVFSEHPEFGHHTKLANSLREYASGSKYGLARLRGLSISASFKPLILFLMK